MPARNCRHCGEPLQGRADKKFCDDQCRSSFNNKANADVSGQMRNINRILRKNRRVLEQALGPRITRRLPMARLSEMGFSQKYHTHTFQNKEGQVYLFSYEYGILPLKGDMAMVVKSKRELE